MTRGVSYGQYAEVVAGLLREKFPKTMELFDGRN